MKKAEKKEHKIRRTIYCKPTIVFNASIETEYKYNISL